MGQGEAIWNSAHDLTAATDANTQLLIIIVQLRNRATLTPGCGWRDEIVTAPHTCTGTRIRPAFMM